MAKTPSSSGPGVDASGRPVVDPTANVLDLVRAAVDRLNDLREKDASHVREIMDLRALHATEMRTAEASRIDAIRAVDVSAVNRAAEVSATLAQTLAAQVAVSAETLRTQVAATATAGQVALAAALEPIQKDVQDLRRVQYEQQGQKAGGSEKTGDTRAVIAIAIAALSTLAAIALGIFAAVTG